MFPNGQDAVTTHLQYYPLSAYSLIFAFFIMFSIIIMNFLFGVAVNDAQVFIRKILNIETKLIK